MNLRPLYNKVVHSVRIFADAFLHTVVHFVLIFEHALSPRRIVHSVRIFADVIACHIVHFVLIFEHALSPCRIVHFACIFAGAYPSTH